MTNPDYKKFQNLEVMISREHVTVDIGFIDNPNAGYGTTFCTPEEMAKELRVVADWLDGRAKP